MNRTATLLAGTTASLWALAVSAAPAAAQVADRCVESAGDAAAACGGEAADEGRNDAIVVTGSRLRRTEFDSPDPIQLIDPRAAERKGESETAEMIQGLPLASGSTQITAALSSNFVNNGGPGAQTVSLRGLGPERTLVLINGRRAGPAGTRGSIAAFDLNVLPLSLVGGVEVLKTGASSIYGSDAVAGVVNVRTRRETDGIEARGFVSAPEKQGGGAYNLGAVWGDTFERGHLMLAVDYYRREELTRGDRGFFGCTVELLPTPGGERLDIRDPRTGRPACSDTQGNFIALIDFLPMLGSPTNVQVGGLPVPLLQFNNLGDGLDGFLNPLAPAATPFQFSAPAGFFPVFYDPTSVGLTNQSSPLERASSVIPKTDRWTLYGEGSFELTPDIELFAEGLFNNRQTYTNRVRQLQVLQFTSRSRLPAVLSGKPALGDPLNTGFTGDVVLQPVIVTDRGDTWTDVDYYRGVAGARGNFGGEGGWHWEAFGHYSRSEGDYGQDIIFADAYDPQVLRTASCVGTLTKVRGVPCMDIRFTDPRVLRGEFTPSEEAFLFGTEVGHTRYEQLTGEASIAGDLLRLPAGSVRTAAGVHWRRDEIEDVPGEVSRAGNTQGIGPAGITAGHSVTAEAFAEVEVPLLADRPFFQNLAATLAGRLTNVRAERASDGLTDTDNGNFTYKFGLSWQVNDVLRLRGTYGTSFRAPALFEQFLAPESGFYTQLQVDPCINYGSRLAQGLVTQRLADNCAADGVPANYTGGAGSATVSTFGNIGNLDPETSRAQTFSVVLTPPSLFEGNRVSLAVDYIDIKVKGEITTLGARIPAACYSSDTFRADPVCGLFVRAPASAPGGPQIVSVKNAFINITQQRNRSIDVTGQMRQDLGTLGELSLLAQMTWQLEDRLELFAGTVTDNNGEAGNPRWTGDFSLGWRRGVVGLVWNLDVIGGTSDLRDLVKDRGAPCFASAFRGGTVCPVVEADAAFYHSVALTLSPDERFDFTLGVANLTDREPPQFSGIFSGIQLFGQTAAAGSQYDYLGRRFFASARARF